MRVLTRSMCAKHRCAYWRNSRCTADKIELGEHQNTGNSDAHTTGMYLECHTFELRIEEPKE